MLSRINDLMLAIPTLIFALVVLAALPQNIFVLIAIIGFTSWPGTARLVRAQTLSVKEHSYVERSRALGATNSQVVSRHILPNVMPVIFANTILTVAIAILAEPRKGRGRSASPQVLAEVGKHPDSEAIITVTVPCLIPVGITRLNCAITCLGSASLARSQSAARGTPRSRSLSEPPTSQVRKPASFSTD